MSQGVLPGMPSPVEYGGELEYWSTPRWAVEAIAPVLQQRMRLRVPTFWNLVDPGCGRGEIFSVLMHELDARPGFALGRVLGIELDEERFTECHERHADPNRVAIMRMDFLKAGPLPLFPDQVLFAGNPPYAYAIDFVEKAIELASPGGIVAMLLQLDFAHGVKTTEKIHSKHPSGLYPLKRRPGFGGEFSSGQRPFAWFVYDLGLPYSEWRVVG